MEKKTENRKPLNEGTLLRILDTFCRLFMFGTMGN